MHLIIFVRQLFCRHMWDTGETISTGKSEDGKTPYFLRRCTCMKCGKVKDIKFPWW